MDVFNGLSDEYFAYWHDTDENDDHDECLNYHEARRLALIWWKKSSQNDDKQKGEADCDI